jgi:hypothetical protein
MANVLMTEGFDMYNGTGANIGMQAKWTASANWSTAGGRFGGQSMLMGIPTGGGAFSAHSWAYRVFDPAGTTTNLSCGIAINILTVDGTDWLLQVNNSSNAALFSVGFSSVGQLIAYSGAFGSTLCSSAAGLLASNTWAYLEVEAVLSATVGSINLYLNGALVASATNVNTLAAAGGGSALQLYGRLNGTPNIWYDDVYVTDTATRLGERRIETLRPNSDNAQTWTRSAGSSNYGLVNETLVDGDTSYVETASTGVRDLYGLTSLSSMPSEIDAVTIVSFAEKTDATTRQLYNSVKSGPTTSDGSGANLAASYGRYDRILTTDPNTSAAWTPSGVNNLLIGPKAA